MTSFADIALTALHPHPHNPRRHVMAGEEMVASVASVGVLTPITVAPHPDIDDAWILIGGHTRTEAARKAGLDTIPALIRDDLVTEPQQLEAMLMENLHRTDLTAVEEAAAYEQLELFGLDVAAIAAATGRALSTVRSRLKLNTLPDGTREKLHDRQLTLAEAEALTEFADDPETLAILERGAGSANFNYNVQQAKDARARTIRHTALIAEFEALSATPSERYGVELAHKFVDEALHSAAGHAGHLAYYKPSWGDPYLICLDPELHAEAEEAARENASDDTTGPAEEQEPARQHQQSEWEAQRAERAALREAQAAAGKLQVAFAVTHLTPLLAPTKVTKESRLLAEAFRAALPDMLEVFAQYYDVAPLLDASGLEHDGTYKSQEAGMRQLRDTVAVGSPSKVLKVFATLMAAHLASSAIVDADNEDQARDGIAVWDWFEAAGHDMCDVDVAARQALVDRLTELAEDGDE